MAIARALLFSVLVAGLFGCGRTVCEEFDEEAEANGCGTEESCTEDDPCPDIDCSEDTEVARQAQCVLDNTADVCEPSEDELEQVAQCVGE